MKKIYVLLVVGASFMMSACSDFLDREPLTTPNSETFLSNASAVNNYHHLILNSLQRQAHFIGYILILLIIQFTFNKDTAALFR